MKLIVASNNKHKIIEIKKILGKYFDEILSLDEVGLHNIEIEETGTTFKENSKIKVDAIKKLKSSYFIISDDSGICVEALNLEPGVYSARYAGINTNDTKNNNLLLNNMKNIKNRKAYYETCITFFSPITNKFYYSSGKVFGEILNEPKGISGFGYDPLFYSYDLKKTFAQATQEEKNSVSHRYIALMELVKTLIENKEI